MWVRCFGIPLNVRKCDSFESFPSSLGSVVELDESTEKFLILEYARVKIHTAKLECINVAWDMNLNKKVHGIRIVEEWPVDPSACCQRICLGRVEEDDSSN